MEVWTFEWGFKGLIEVRKTGEEGKNMHLGAKCIIHKNLTPNENSLGVLFPSLSDCPNPIA